MDVSVMPPLAGHAAPTHGEPWGYIEFTSREELDGDCMEDIDHDDTVLVSKETTVYLSVDDLVALRDQINKELRKARRDDLI